MPKNGKSHSNQKSTSSSTSEKDSVKRLTRCNGDPAQLQRAKKDARDYIIANFGMLREEVNGRLDKISHIDYLDYLDDKFPLPLRPTPPPEVGDTLLTPEQQEEIDQLGDPGEGEGDAEEFQAAIDAIVRDYRIQNHAKAVVSYNRVLDRRHDLEKTRDELIKQFAAGKRKKAVHWLLYEWLTPDARDRVTQHPKFKAVSGDEEDEGDSEDDYSSVYQILCIATELFSDYEEDEDNRVENARAALQTVAMRKPTGFVSYNKEFGDALQTFKNAGGILGDSVLIKYFVKGLHPTSFGTVKDAYEDKAFRKLLKSTWLEFREDMVKRNEKWMRSNRTAASEDTAQVLHTAVERKASQAKHESATTLKAPAVSASGGASSTTTAETKPSHPECIFCKRHHPQPCHNVKAVEAYLAKCKESKEKADAARGAKKSGEEKKSNLSVTISKQDSDSVSSEKHYFQLESDVLPSLFDPEDTSSYGEVTAVMISSVQKQRESGEFYELIKDDGADIGLIATSNPELGCNPRPTKMHISGAHVDDMGRHSSGPASARLDYKYDFGPAVLYGSLNVLCEYDMLVNYDKIELEPHLERYVHKTKGYTWDFRRNPKLYGDKKWHHFIPREEYLSVLSFYAPKLVSEASPTAHEIKLIEAAKHDHHRLGHPEDQVFAKMIEKKVPSITATKEGLELWRKLDGPCPGCVQGKLQAHAQLPSSKPVEVAVGKAIAGDIMYAERVPAAVFVDIESQCPFLEPINGRTLGDLKMAISATMVNWTSNGHSPDTLRYDRESALRHAGQWIKGTFGVELHMMAAGQKEPHAEVNNRILKAVARTARWGILNRHGYDFKWVKWLLADAVKVVQRTPKRGEELCPLEKFTGKPVDYMRDMRAELGEIVLVERPKRGVATGVTEPKAEWAVVVERSMNTSGVVGVVIVETRRLAHRLQFVRARVPEEVLTQVRALSNVSHFMLDIDSELDMTDPKIAAETEATLEQPIATDQTIDNGNSYSTTTDPPPPLESPTAPTTESDTQLEKLDNDGEDGECEDDTSEEGEPTSESKESTTESTGHTYNLRPRHKKSILNTSLLRGLYSGFTEDGEPVEYLEETMSILAAQITYQQALKSQHADAAKESMIKELKQALAMKTFKGKHYRELSADERHLVLKATSLYKEKYLPTGEFEKSKCRVLVRGDMQKAEFTGASSSPTVRIETVFWFLAVATYIKAIVFKVDFLSAYLNSPRTEDVKHKYVMLPKEIASVLVELEPSFSEFLLNDGRILVEMLKLMYGYREAGLAWYKLLTSMFVADGFEISYWDQCLLTKHKDGVEIAVAVSVDDCLFRVDSIATKEKVLKMCEKAFSGITYQDGPVLNHLGMVLDFSVPGEVSITQTKFIDDLCESVPEAKPSDTPMSPAFNDLSANDITAPCDRERYRSVIMSCTYAGTRTYPEIRYACCVLAAVVAVATLFHWRAMLRLVGYLKATRATHRFVIRPGSLNVISCADASHADHPNARSHTGGCVGVKGNGEDIADCYFVFISHMQHITTKSSMECEIVAQDDIADWVVWSAGIRDVLVPPSFLYKFKIDAANLLYRDNALTKEVYDNFEKSLMQSDNQSAIIALKNGRGSFKKSKHILKRYFYITELIEAGRVELKWLPSTEMPADILTKPVTAEIFGKLVSKIIGKSSRS